MKDLPNLTVERHHLLCLGMMAMCYPHVSPELQSGIREACEAAQAMGAKINAKNLGSDLPLATNFWD